VCIVEISWRSRLQLRLAAVSKPVSARGAGASSG